MKHSFFLVSALVLGIICLAAGPAASGPEQGLLVDENGGPVTGYSPVIVEDGLAYPVCNEKENAWYTVNVIGQAPDGTILCTVGERMGEIPEGVCTGDGGPGEDIEDEGEGASGPAK
jgi:hypothetical protein